MDQATMQYAADELTKLFPKTDKEPVYSLGFQRWQKLNRREREAMWILHDFDQTACIADLQNR